MAFIGKVHTILGIVYVSRYARQAMEYGNEECSCGLSLARYEFRSMVLYFMPATNAPDLVSMKLKRF